MLIARPRMALGYFVADRDAIDFLTGNCAPRAETPLINRAKIFATSFLTKVLTGIIKRAATSATARAAAFPFPLLSLGPLMVLIEIAHNDIKIENK